MLYCTALYCNANHNWDQILKVISVKFFSKLKFGFFGYFDPTNIFFYNKAKNFRGDLSDVSAKTATLLPTPQTVPLPSACAPRRKGGYYGSVLVAALT